MLTERFIASVGVPNKAPAPSESKDAAIIIQEFQPLKGQRAVFKKNATPPNCLAVNESHIFAAQAGKAVVHVYNREKGNQEATVPFAERITCITLACDGTVLVLGTGEGRIFLWEIASGRQVTTVQSHLQSITAVAVDPTSTFLLSASADATVHVWSIPSLLSFSHAGVDSPPPLRTFVSHRSQISALALGHSSSFCNIAVTASADKTCLVWDYHTNSVLCTYLLPAVPTSLALDTADRVVYIGYEDGSVQLLDLFAQSSLRDRGLRSIKSAHDATTPIQPPARTRWISPDDSVGKVYCLDVSFDGSTILSGHKSGAILLWDVARSGSPTTLLQLPLPGPVTNLFFLPVTGFGKEIHRGFRVSSIVKPKFAAFDSSSSGVPGNYALGIELASADLDGEVSEFDVALASTTFTSTLISEGLDELLTWVSRSRGVDGSGLEEDADFMALDSGEERPRELSLQEQNVTLQAELDALRQVQQASFDKIDRIDAERRTLIQREQKRRLREQESIIGSGYANGTHHSGQELDESSDE